MKRIFRLLQLSLLVLLLFGFSKTAYGTDNGGVVQTNGIIGFYEESEPSTSETESSSSEPEPVSGSTSDFSSVPGPGGTLPDTNTKPQGKYPSTGELVKKSLTFSGIALVAAAFLFFLWKRKKDKEEEESRS